MCQQVVWKIMIKEEEKLIKNWLSIVGGWANYVQKWFLVIVGLLLKELVV